MTGKVKIVVQWAVKKNSLVRSGREEVTTTTTNCASPSLPMEVPISVSFCDLGLKGQHVKVRNVPRGVMSAPLVKPNFVFCAVPGWDVKGGAEEDGGLCQWISYEKGEGEEEKLELLEF